MSKPKFTPGPWAIVRYTNYDGFSVQSKTAPEFGCIAERWESVKGVSDAERNEARLSNARLIAAAPELYEFVQNLRKKLHDNTLEATSKIDIRALLKKIEGAQ